MTYSASKNISNWTKKHTEFSVKFNLGTVCGNLWRYLLTLGKEGTKVDFILNKFQKYIKRLRGKPHDFEYVKKQFKKLVFLRIIRIDFDYRNNSYRLIINHPDVAIPKNPTQNYSQNSAFIPKKEASNIDKCETGSNSSSINNLEENTTNDTESISGSDSNNSTQEVRIDRKEYLRRIEIIKVCAKYGINFNAEKQTTEQIYKYPLEQIYWALRLFNKRSKTGTIDNPQGWLITCLRYQYWEDEYLQNAVYPVCEPVEEDYEYIIKYTVQNKCDLDYIKNSFPPSKSESHK